MAELGKSYGNPLTMLKNFLGSGAKNLSTVREPKTHNFLRPYLIFSGMYKSDKRRHSRDYSLVEGEMGLYFLHRQLFCGQDSDESCSRVSYTFNTGVGRKKVIHRSC